MIIDGAPVKGGIADSHGDHRIAMACAVAALGASGPVTIENAGSVDKSYHEFYRDMVKLGVDIR
jgi:3-phosphoshikimate 1-carboxyvinyltransferase